MNITTQLVSHHESFSWQLRPRNWILTFLPQLPVPYMHTSVQLRWWCLLRDCQSIHPIQFFDNLQFIKWNCPETFATHFFSFEEKVIIYYHISISLVEFHYVLLDQCSLINCSNHNNGWAWELCNPNLQGSF